MEFDLIQGSFDLALRNAAIADSIHRELADGSLVRVLPEYRVDDETALWLVYPKSNVLTAKVRIFIDFLLEKIGKAPVWTEAGSRSPG